MHGRLGEKWWLVVCALQHALTIQFRGAVISHLEHNSATHFWAKTFETILIGF